MSDLSFSARLSAIQFKRQRADYYAYLANMLRSTKGRVDLETLIGRDAERFAGKPRGILAALWTSRLGSNGANLAEAWQGTLPDDEVAIVRVALHSSGEAALESALRDIARSAKLTDRIKKTTHSVLLMAIVGIVIAVLMWTVMPIFAAEHLLGVFGLQPDTMGPRAQWLTSYAESVKHWAIPAIAAAIGTLALILWSINNWTGRLRNWADQHIVLWRAVRDVKGALFLSAMSTLVQRRGGGHMMTLMESLQLLSRSLRSHWMAWRVGEISENIAQRGGDDSQAFDTPLLSREMYFYLRDMQESNGFAEGLAETGRYIETHVAEQIEKRMALYRWILLAIALIAVIAMVGNIYAIIDEMRRTLANSG